ncbi:MAG TPA: polyphenol oxidase family protein, partial [Anaerolineaceae bacterium]|nr:polyphenol oxidase family protein [Anaerolineaceae bacterium]
FYDPKKQVVGIAHAGWQGTVKKIASATVLAMQKHYGCLPDDIWAGIGPSIGPDHYEVGPDVIEQVRQTFGAHSDEILISVNSRTHLNLWLANKIVLNESGVNTVSIAGECTACHLEDWYSHRGEHGKAGRFGAVLALEG